MASFWNVDPFTTEVVHTGTLDNFRRIFEQDVYRDVAWRTIKMAGTRHGRRRRARLPDRVLHGSRRVTEAAEPPRRRRAHAALGELPRQGVRLANDASGAGVLSTGLLDPFGVSFDRRLDDGPLARLHVLLAPLHDPAHLRWARADPAVAPRGLGRPRRAGRCGRSSRSRCRSRSRPSSPARSSRSRSRSATTSCRSSSRASSSSARSSTTTTGPTCRLPRRSRWCRSAS